MNNPSKWELFWNQLKRGFVRVIGAVIAMLAIAGGIIVLINWHNGSPSPTPTLDPSTAVIGPIYERTPAQIIRWR